MAEEGRERRDSSLSSHVISNALFRALGRFGQSSKDRMQAVDSTDILDSFAKASRNMAMQQVTLQASTVAAIADAIQKESHRGSQQQNILMSEIVPPMPIPVPIQYDEDELMGTVNPLTGAASAALINGYKTAAPHAADSFSRAIQTGFDDALPTLHDGMQESANKWKSTLIGYLDDIQAGFQDKLGGTTLTDALKKSVGDVHDFFTDSPIVAPVVLSFGVAAEFQGDMVRVAKIAGGFYAESFQRATDATLALFTQQAITQDQASEIIATFAALNPVIGLTKDQYFELGKTSANLVQVLDYSADEAALLVHRFVLLGLTASDIDDLNASLFNTSRALGLSNEAVKQIQDITPNLASALGLFEAEQIKALQAGVGRYTKFLQQLGVSASDAVSNAESILYAIVRQDEEGQRIANALSSQLGSYQAVVRAAQEDPAAVLQAQGQTILTRFESVLKSNDALFRQFAEGSAIDSVGIVAHAKQTAEEQTGASIEIIDRLWSELRKRTKASFVESGGDMVALRQDIGGIVREMGMIPDLPVPNKEQQDWNEALGAANSSMSAIGSQIFDIGQALLISFGLPLLNIVGPALQYVLDFVKGISEYLEDNEGVRRWVSYIVGGLGVLAGGYVAVQAGLTILSLVKTVGTLVTSVSGLPSLFTLAGKGITLFSTKMIPLAISSLATLKAGTIALTATMLANPIFAGIAIAAGLIAGLVFLEKKFGFLSKALEWVKEKALGAWDSITAFFADASAFDVAKMFFPILYLFDIIPAIFSTAFNFVKRLITEPKQLIMDTIGGILNILPDWAVDRFDSLRSLRDSFNSAIPTAPAEVVSQPLPPQTTEFIDKLSTMEVSREKTTVEMLRYGTQEKETKMQDDEMMASVRSMLSSLKDDMEGRERFRHFLRLVLHSGDESLGTLTQLLARGDL